MFSYEKFRALCDERKVTPYQVSKGTSNVSTVTLSDWKNGKYIPKIEKIKEIADFFNVSIDYFMK